jgi:hypothetical protein
MQAECDLTLSTLATYRASVTDNGNGTTFDFQYQENISVGEIQQAVIGLEAQNGSTVSASTCYSDTMQTTSNGSTQIQCALTFTNNMTYNATVTDNGLSVRTYQINP